jgi:hypothetical protein
MSSSLLLEDADVLAEEPMLYILYLLAAVRLF